MRRILVFLLVAPFAIATITDAQRAPSSVSSVSSVPSADELHRTVALMAKIGFASAATFAPDGKRIAFVSNISGSPQVWTVAVEGGWPDQITAFDDPVSAIEYSPDGAWIAVQVAPGGGLNEQVYVMKPDGSGLRRLTEGGKENNQYDAWLPDSKGLLIASNRRDPRARDTWRVDLATGAFTLVAKNPGLGFIGEISDDGRFATLGRLVSRGDNDAYRVALDGSGEIHLTPHQPPATFNDIAFGPTPDVVYLAGNPRRDRTVLGRITIKDGKAGPFEVVAMRPDAELQGFEVNHRRTVAVLNWNVAGRNELTFLDLATGEQHPAPALPGDIVGGFEFSDDDTKLAMNISGSNRPNDIWVMEMGTATLRQLTRSPHAGIDLDKLVRPELTVYSAHDGLRLTGWLYRPPGQKPPYATVLSFHGGPEGQERPTLNTTYQALLANGIAVFAPNVRGSSGFGKKFVNLDNGPLRVNGVRDIRSSVDHVVAAGLADPKRLGIMGGSYGGYMVMAGVTEYPDLFAAGANLFGVVNFETFFKHTEPWMAAISTKEYGDPATEAAMLRQLSPIHKIDIVKTPLLVLHGANDTNVPVVEAEQIVESLRKRNVPVQYVLFPDEGHGWRKTPNRIRAAVEIVKFFTEQLK